MRPYVKTYSVCVGNRVCNAKCPFCIARMTGTAGVEPGEAPVIDPVRLRKGAELAKHLGATTALITGKGEPTLWPERLYEALDVVKEVFPLVEVQTNGIALSDWILGEMWARGVTMVALSAVHYRTEANKECYGDKYPFSGLMGLVDAVHLKNMSVRVTCMLCKGWIDSVNEVQRLIRWAHTQKVEQLTIRAITKPEIPSDKTVGDWVTAHQIDEKAMEEIYYHIYLKADRLNTLVHGNVYAYNLGDGDEQNVCLSDCLTHNPDSNEIRQLIYCPDGHVRYDWVHDAAIVF